MSRGFCITPVAGLPPWRKSLPAVQRLPTLGAPVRPARELTAKPLAMLNAIRKNAGSWIVKVLMLLLVASFAIWGIGDIFYGGGQNPAVATVGDAEIPASELADAFNRSVNNLQRQLGPDFDRERAIQLGVMQQALQSLVAERLISLRANDMGLAVPDDALRAMITDNPAFQSAGQFDRSRFDQLLRLNGLSEDGYLAGLRQDVMRERPHRQHRRPGRRAAGSGRRPVSLPQRAAARALRRGAGRFDHRRAGAERG